MLKESIWKLNFLKALTGLSLVYQVHWGKFIFHGDKKVAVMDILSSIPEIRTFFVPFFSIVFEVIWTYFEGV